MPLVHVALVVLTLFVQDSQPARGDCREWHECRQLALDAAERQDYERFHDLAWRAVQTGPKNDPTLMYLLARAQSLSGRPGDALVMLQRLAQMGTKTDAATNDDFRRVRALPGWAEFAGTADTSPQPSPSIAPAVPPSPTAVVTPTPAPNPTPPDRRTAEAGSHESPPSQPSDKPANRLKPAVTAESSAVAPSKPVEPRSVPGVTPVESLRFTSSSATPAGIAYDGVSRRFIVGDRNARKLSVVDEFSRHVNNLASAQSAGFGNIAALEIDPRQGNLWVVSSENGAVDNPNNAAAAPSSRATLHKLQLISGRVLQSFASSDRVGPARFADVAVTSDGTVLVLDDAGQRVFRLKPRGTDLELAASLNDRPLTIAPASDTIAYVATGDGIVVVDLSSKNMTSLKASSGVDLARLSRLRWHKGSLVGIQQTTDGSYRAVRFTLDSTGKRATRQQILDGSLPTTDPTAATISGGILYYLASGDGAEMVIRKITLP
jgi:hypothetical protein